MYFYIWGVTTFFVLLISIVLVYFVIRYRRRNAFEIPRPIEAICLKAMAEHRDDRYATAEGVGVDVVRFLDGNPVSAYRENVFERAFRFVNKNRFIVVLILAYLIMRLIVFFWVGR